MMEINTDLHSWDHIARRIREDDHITYHETTRQLHFKNISFKRNRGEHLLQFHPGSFQKVIFENCSFISHAEELMTVSRNNSHKQNFEFSNCSFKSLRFSNLNELSVLHQADSIDSLTIDSVENLSLVDLTFKKASISKCSFNRLFEIKGGEGISLDIRDSEFKENLQLQKAEFSFLNLYNLSFKNSECFLKDLHTEEQIEIKAFTGLAKLSIHDNKQILIIEGCQSKHYSIYRNRNDIFLTGNKLDTAKINCNKLGRLVLQLNQVEESLLIEKNEQINLELVKQNSENITIEQNQGAFYFCDNTDYLIPSIVNNAFTELTFTDNQTLNSDQDMSIREATSVTFRNNYFSSLKLNLHYVQKVSIENYNGSIHAIIAGSKFIRFSLIRNGYNSTLEIKASEECRINDCEFNSLWIKDSNIKSIFELKNVSAESISASNLVAEELRIKNERKSDYELWERLSLNSSTIKNTYLVDIKYPTVNFNDFSSEYLYMQNEKVQQLFITQCSTPKVSFSEYDNFINQKSWHFQNLPINSISINGDSFIEYVLINGFKDYERNDNPNLLITDCFLDKVLVTETPISVKSKRTVFQEFEVRDIENITSKLNFYSSDDLIDQLIFNDVSLSRLELNQTKFGTCNVLYSRVSEFLLTKFPNDSDLKDGRVHIEDLKESSIRLEDNNLESIKIINTRPQSLKIKNLNVLNFLFSNFGLSQNSSHGIEFTGINKTITDFAQTLTFLECDLTNARFNSCYFDSFNQLKVGDSILDKIRCTTTTWPKNVTAPEGSSKQFDIREACRQLKLAMAEHQDKVSELQFHALEMAAYSKIVLGKKPRWKFWINFNDKLSLLAGWTNVFGLNWWIPLVAIVVISTIHYGGMIWSHYGISPFSEGYLSCFEPTDYFQTYNPTHRLNQFNLEGSISRWTAAIDFSSKIWSAFFIYQIVAAFRKFRRK